MKPAPELLLPAGSLEKLKIAILYGADAVYMGTPDLSLRTQTQMTLEDVAQGIAYAQERGRKAYLTLNLFAHNKDIEKLPVFLETIRKLKPDGLLVADPGVFRFVREQAPELDLHVSTQANVCSWLGVRFWQDMGAKLVVLAREVSFAEFCEIREKCPETKLEIFVHGAMCMTYSGRCLLSNYLAQRGANQGNCANACRWKYKVKARYYLEEEQRPGELLPIEEDERGSYILNAKDLCLMPKLDEILAAGPDSLKIEGRGRSAYYVGVTARAYRAAIDAWRKDPDAWTPEPYLRELVTIPGKGWSLAFHEGALRSYAHNYEDTRTYAPWEYAAIVREAGPDAFLLDVKNRLEQGDVLEFLSPFASEPLFLRIYEFHNVRTGKTTREEGINAGQQPLLRIPYAWFHEEEAARLRREFPPLTLVRKEKALSREAWARLALDREAFAIEQGKGNETAYEEKRKTLVAEIESAAPDLAPRALRLGVDGCCGRGCNGCQHFWNDPKYEKARALLKSKKQHHRLSASEAKEATGVPPE